MGIPIHISPRRVVVLLLKDIRQGSANFLVLYGLVIPVVLTLLVNLIFGDLFSQAPRLGLVDLGSSEAVVLLQQADHIRTTVYASEEAMRDAVRRGVEEVGLVLPAGLDATLLSGGEIRLHSMRWGEATIKNLLTVEIAINRVFIALAEIPQPIQVQPVQLGSGAAASWSERMMPLILIMAVTLGGLLLAATTLIEERQQRTLNAVTTTVASLLDVYVAKLVLGMVVGIVVGLVTLALNRAFGSQPILLIAVIGLGALAASATGILLGSVAKDMDTFMAILKSLGIVLYAPGLLELVPQAPAWISKLFPTYYIMHPILEITQKGASLSGIVTDLAILCAIVGTLLLVLLLLVERQEEAVALAG